MNIDLTGIDFNKEIRMSLCKPDKVPFMEIHNIENFSRKIALVGIDEISFDVPLYRPDGQNKSVKNELFDEIKGDYYIYLNDGEDEEGGQYFIIQNPEESKDLKGITKKSISAFSGEYALSSRHVVDFDRESRQLYDPSNGLDKDGYEVGFLNLVEKITTWRVEYVSPKVEHKYRELKFSDSSVLDALKVCQEKFNCVIFYNTVKETLKVYDVSEIGGNQGLVISDENFIKRIVKNINTDEIITRLYMYGDDTISFHDQSILGLPYIEDISFYRDFNYVSNELRDALYKYEALVRKLNPNFVAIIKELNDFTKAGNALKVDYSANQKNLERTEILLDSLISALQFDESNNEKTRTDITKTKNVIADLKKKIEKNQKDIEANAKSLTATNEKLKELRKQADPAKTLTEEELREYNRYIKESIVRDNSFKHGMENELKEYALDEMKRLCYPTISFETDLEDFRKKVRFFEPMARLKVGDFVYLNSDDLNIDVEVRLFEMELNYDRNQIKLKFGNKYSATNSTMYLSELIGKIQSASNRVSLRDSEWNKSIEKYSEIKERLEEDLDLSKKAILTAKNQKPILDERGLWLTKNNPDGTIDNKQVRAINNTIAITNDNWNTVSTAITGDGINAQVIRGRLGEFVTVNANQILVNEDANDSALASFIKENGGKTYRQVFPPDIKGNAVDDSIKISDGALWIRTNTNGTVQSIYRYSANFNGSWTGIGNYTGRNHWEEISELIYKGKSYGGATLDGNGLSTTRNGVKINSNGMTVSNNNGSHTVNTEVNANGFYIKKDGHPIFYVDSNGVLHIQNQSGSQYITVNDSGIKMPPSSSVEIGTNSSSRNYVNITSNGVQFGNNYGFFYDTSSGDLTIGGRNGLRYDARNSTLYIGGEPVTKLSELIRLKKQLEWLANVVDSNSRVSAYVQFG